jgi:hypothetical protein
MANRKTKKQQTQQSNEVAANMYHPSDYKSNNETEKGLAEAHEQVSDAYMEGTVDQNLK